ncbi:hypothetical protein LY78DRAFT_232555 [Colletotrichum sublineola]|nr:hypothetical protein LY78DRAFT_232555 [Colletotrichum sublineola]
MARSLVTMCPETPTLFIRASVWGVSFSNVQKAITRTAVLRVGVEAAIARPGLFSSLLCCRLLFPHPAIPPPGRRFYLCFLLLAMHAIWFFQRTFFSLAPASPPAASAYEEQTRARGGGWRKEHRVPACHCHRRPLRPENRSRSKDGLPPSSSKPRWYIIHAPSIPRLCLSALPVSTIIHSFLSQDIRAVRPGLERCCQVGRPEHFFFLFFFFSLLGF